MDISGLAAWAKDHVLREYQKDGCEHAVVIDENANKMVAVCTSGSRKEVIFQGVIAELFDDPSAALAVHHNHPDGGTLSIDDLTRLTDSAGVRSIWVHHNDGSSFCCTRTATCEVLENGMHLVKKVIHSLPRESLRHLNEDQVVAAISHGRLLALDYASLLKYEFDFSPAMANIIHAINGDVRELANIAAMRLISGGVHRWKT